MKKIAIFQDNLGLGGIQKSLINLLNNLDYTKYEIDLYLFDREQFFDVDLSDKVNLIYKKPFFKSSKLLPFSLIKKIYKNDIKESYDIAIDFNSYRNETALYASTVKAKKRYIMVHNDIVLKKKNEWKYRVLFNLFKSKYKDFDSYIGVSRGALDSLNAALGKKRNGAYVLPNIIDTKEIEIKAKEASDFTVSDKYYNLVTMGRLCHQKGFDILLDMIAKLKRKDLRLYIIGNGPDEAKLKRKIEAHNLSSKVFLLGAHKNPFPIMNKMDGFVLTSRYEGQGMVILEAKALGLKLFTPKRLEKYNEGIKGYRNLPKELEKARRQTKSFNSLKSYNENILKEFEKIAGVK